jgi:hypothetical protein
MWDGAPERVDYPARPGDDPGPVAAARAPLVVEQRWYCGSHGNVGGGGVADPATENPLSTIPREWLVGKAREAGLEVDDPAPPLSGREWAARASDAYAAFLSGPLGGLLGRGYRRIFPRHLRPTGRTLAEVPSPELRRRSRELGGYRPENPGFDTLLRLPAP